jgi:hypothetical protein
MKFAKRSVGSLILLALVAVAILLSADFARCGTATLANVTLSCSAESVQDQVVGVWYNRGRKPMYVTNVAAKGAQYRVGVNAPESEPQAVVSWGLDDNAPLAYGLVSLYGKTASSVQESDLALPFAVEPGDSIRAIVLCVSNSTSGYPVTLKFTINFRE